MGWQTGGGWQDSLWLTLNAQTWSALQTFSASPGIDLKGTAPSMTWTDTTASAKSLTIAVDTNLAQLRESAGASGSLLVLDLANNRVGIGRTPSAYIFEISSSMSITAGVGVFGGFNFFSNGQTNNQLTIAQGYGSASDNIAYIYNRANQALLFGTNNTERMRIDAFGNLVIGFAGSGASLLDLRAGDLTMSGANGQKYLQGRLTELVAVGSGISTKATTIQIPADAVVYAVPVRVKTQPGGTATMTVTATTSGTAFQKGANISTATGTTDVGNKNTPVNYNSVAAQTITFTFDAPTTDALGEIRVDIYYHVPTAPTS